MLCQTYQVGLPIAPITKKRRTAQALIYKNKSSASLCVHDFFQDMRRASELKGTPWDETFSMLSILKM